MYPDDKKVFQIEKRRAVELADVERVSIQMRQVETILLNKMKAERDENMTSINVLINYSYQELLTSMDKLKATEDQLERHKNETLKPLLNLMEITMQLSGIKVPFDGRILDGNEQVGIRTILSVTVNILDGGPIIGTLVRWSDKHWRPIEQGCWFFRINTVILGIKLSQNIL